MITDTENIVGSTNQSGKNVAIEIPIIGLVDIGLVDIVAAMAAHEQMKSAAMRGFSDLSAKNAWHSAQKVINFQRCRLQEAGLMIKAVYLLGSANCDRLDRDDPFRVTDEDWQTVYKA
jgi:hypothetical protein